MRLEKWNRLAELETIMSASGQATGNPNPSVPIPTKLDLARAAISRLDIKLCEGKLRQMIAKFNQLSESLDRVKKILHDPDQDKTMDWYWKDQETELASKLEKYGPRKQAALRERIRSLEARTALFESPAP